MSPRTRPPGPLAGLRVVELSPTMLGALVGQHLGELGADVVRVEPPGGDALRDDPPAFTASGRNKRSLVLDLGDTEERELLVRLVGGSDVLVDGHPVGVLARAGFAFERVRRIAPRLVYCAVTPYGARGPYAQRLARDPNVAATAGLGSGAPGVAPWLPPWPVASVIGALYATTAVLAALRARDRTGEGQLLDASAVDALAALLGPLFLGVSSCDPAVPGCGVYRARDGAYLSLAATTERSWARLCEVFGRPDLRPAREAAADDPARRAVVDAEVAAALSLRTRDDWLDLLADDEIGVAPVHDLASAQRDPHLVDRGVFATLAAMGGRWPAVRFPVLLGGTPAEPPSPPPALGAHDEPILRELGVDEALISAHLARKSPA